MKQSEAMAAISLDIMSIYSMVTQAVNEKLEAVVIGGVANVTDNNANHSHMIRNTRSIGDRSGYSTI